MKEEECRRSVGGCRALCKNASWREAGVSSVETTTCDSFTSTLACARSAQHTRPLDASVTPYLRYRLQCRQSCRQCRARLSLVYTIYHTMFMYLYSRQSCSSTCCGRCDAAIPIPLTTVPTSNLGEVNAYLRSVQYKSPKYPSLCLHQELRAERWNHDVLHMFS